MQLRKHVYSKALNLTSLRAVEILLNLRVPREWAEMLLGVFEKTYEVATLALRVIS